jgi:FXSXX-COOH protein
MNTITPPDPARVPLTRLAADGRSPVLARVVRKEQEGGPKRVPVAAFQSAV